MELEIPDTDVDGWTVVAASGEIDVATAPALRDRLTDLVEAGSTRLVVDLEDVDFIDSTGLGVLVGGVRRARAEDGDLRLVCTNTRILKVFEATGLHEVFTIGSTVDDAVASEAQ
ncbi:STAS domain-containing protein [Acidimicrobiia bacterium EGI L10123]|uniref:STAS domain-containing protein n=1 Tax=Salinilacustrithrix flava TaxID=2957203 RepID=UPI003D7C172A|nr:STAS domain-containing protein [Acidimicrobiia bacterium EGI L10123]